MAATTELYTREASHTPAHTKETRGRAQQLPPPPLQIKLSGEIIQYLRQTFSIILHLETESRAKKRPTVYPTLFTPRPSNA